MNVINQSIVDALSQFKDLLELCNEKQYIQTNEFGSSSIGKHVRHVLDHCHVFVKSYESALLDYNERRRNTEVEKNIELAKEEVLYFIQWFSEKEITQDELDIKTEVSFSETNNVLMKSNYQRELIYIINHTVHHAAYASLVLKTLGISAIPEKIGLASSTASYIRNTV